MKTSTDIELKRQRRRYRLHYMARRNGYKLMTKRKTFYVKSEKPIENKYVKALCDEYDYAIQTEL